MHPSYRFGTHVTGRIGMLPVQPEVSGKSDLLTDRNADRIPNLVKEWRLWIESGPERWYSGSIRVPKQTDIYKGQSKAPET